MASLVARGYRARIDGTGVVVAADSAGGNQPRGGTRRARSTSATLEQILEDAERRRAADVASQGAAALAGVALVRHRGGAGHEEATVTARPLGSLSSDAGVVPLTPVPAGLLVGGVRVDSRTVKPGDLFFALRGADDDGARHARHAVANGAVARRRRVAGARRRARASPGSASPRRASRWASSPASGSDDPTRR